MSQDPIPYAFPKLQGIPQPRFARLGEGEVHFAPEFVASPQFPAFWRDLTGKPFPPPETWKNLGA